MRGRLILLSCLLIASIGFAVAADSSILADFDLLGCKTSSEYLPYQSCSRYGLYWCNSKGKLLNVFTNKNICRGKKTSPEEKDDDCCPPNYYCNAYNGESSTNICEPRSYQCSEFNNQVDCENNGCLWWNEDPLNPYCRDRSSLTSCSDYKRESSCNQDLYGLGKTNGIGTEICRGMYSGTKLVIINSCRCKWVLGAADNKCVLTYNVTDEFEQDKIFTCDKTFDSSKPCINNEKEISWEVTFSSIPPGWRLDPQNPEDFDCKDGFKELRCDQAVAKLPFFEIENFIICFLLIFAVYFFQENKL
jgi:hypothetical protein